VTSAIQKLVGLDVVGGLGWSVHWAGNLWGPAKAHLSQLGTVACDCRHFEEVTCV
jgi:hypothetical protein